MMADDYNLLREIGTRWKNGFKLKDLCNIYTGNIGSVGLKGKDVMERTKWKREMQNSSGGDPRYEGM